MMPATAMRVLHGITTDPVYLHLSHLTDDRGVFEHALGDEPRREHGYCVDDVARALIVAVREPNQTLELGGIAGLCLRFLTSAIEPDGKSHNRLNSHGEWTDRASTDDCWGRSLWALGVAAVQAPMADTRDDALAAFDGLVVELHLTNTAAREPWRHTSVVAPVAVVRRWPAG